MRHINHACVGDPLYGRGDDRANRGLRRQFLHSWRVSFDHPVTGERISCRDTLPEDLLGILEGIESASMGRTDAGERICPQLLGK
jgi:23S rRNA pseudouridine1911/1915/1917 synthase